MRIIGYQAPEPDEDQDNVTFLELAEINLRASPDELRKIAHFLLNTADAMDDMGAAYDHEHLSDKYDEFESSPHLVTMRE